MIALGSSPRFALRLLACAAILSSFAGHAQAAADVGKRAATPGAPKPTFGTKPCGRLVSMEDVEAVFKTKVPMIDIVEEGTCVYEGENGLPLYRVRLASGPKLRCTAPDGTYLGKPAERIAGIGDQAFWSRSAGTLCFVRGDVRVQLSFDSTLPGGADPKTAAIGLAAKAASRLPLDTRP